MNIAKLIWQLPQVIAGIIVVKITKATQWEDAPGNSDVSIYMAPDALFGVSFGPIIILGANILQMDSLIRTQTVLHESGHSKQSLILGPLYLLVVGLPSLTMNLMSRWSVRFGTSKFALNYYRRWPESWADKLGGISR